MSRRRKRRKIHTGSIEVINLTKKEIRTINMTAQITVFDKSWENYEVISRKNPNYSEDERQNKEISGSRPSDEG